MRVVCSQKTHLLTKKHFACLSLSSHVSNIKNSLQKPEVLLPVSILIFCAATVWLRPHIELIVGAKVWPWGATPTGSCIGWRARAAPLHLLHACQVPWVKLGAEHNITKASLHGSELWPFLAAGSSWSASPRSDTDGLLGNKRNYTEKKYRGGKRCASGETSSEIN